MPSLPAPPLPNPIWLALSGPHLRFGDGTDRARRYEAEVTPFGALCDPTDDGDWTALGDLLGPGGETFTFAGSADAPAGWGVPFRLDGVQLALPEGAGVDVAGDLGWSDDGIERLGPDDVDEMLDLVARTQPGPFLRRTIELGTFLGVRHETALVAMAGQRLRVEHEGDTAIEISAVCTDDDHRGRGLAAALVAAQVDVIRAEGARPIMHVAQSNVGALRVYERLGFVPTWDFAGVHLVAPA